MKKLSFSLLAAAALTLSSCSIGNDETSQTVSYGVVNLISPLDGSAPSVSLGWYNIEFNFSKNYARVMCKDLMIDNISHQLISDTLKYKGNDTGDVIIMDSFRGMVDGSSDLTLNNASFEITSQTNPIPASTVGSTSAVDSYGYVTVLANYNIGSRWNVKTFYPDACYKGTTITTYPDSEGGLARFTNNDITYRIVFEQDLKKANVAIYNAKFAEAAPTLACITLEKLDVTYSTGKYVISGKDIVPKVVEGGASTPNEKYTFNSFTLTPASNLTDATIQYQVATVFNGSFTGSYLQQTK